MLTEFQVQHKGTIRAFIGKDGYTRCYQDGILIDVVKSSREPYMPKNYDTEWQDRNPIVRNRGKMGHALIKLDF